MDDFFGGTPWYQETSTIGHHGIRRGIGQYWSIAKKTWDRFWWFLVFSWCPQNGGWEGLHEAAITSEVIFPWYIFSRLPLNENLHFESISRTARMRRHLKTKTTGKKNEPVLHWLSFFLLILTYDAMSMGMRIKKWCLMMADIWRPVEADLRVEVSNKETEAQLVVNVWQLWPL